MTLLLAGTTTWTSWHLHLASDARSAQDRVLHDVLRPVVAELGDRPWFFMRFWQGGTHLRFRVGDLEPAGIAAVERALRDRLAVSGRLEAGEQPIDEESYQLAARAQAATERGPDSVVQPLLPPGVHRAEYSPEYQRYGGAALMPLTERLFRLSSEAVLRALPAGPTSRDRTTLALRGTMAAAAAIGGPAEQAEFYARSLEAWRRWGGGWTAAEFDRLCDVEARPGQAPPPQSPGPFAAWQDALTELAGRLDPPGPVVFSHVHMLHNRLGRSLPEELRTYAWLARVFPEVPRP